MNLTHGPGRCDPARKWWGGELWATYDRPRPCNYCIIADFWCRFRACTALHQKSSLRETSEKAACTKSRRGVRCTLRNMGRNVRANTRPNHYGPGPSNSPGRFLC